MMAQSIKKTRQNNEIKNRKIHMKDLANLISGSKNEKRLGF